METTITEVTTLVTETVTTTLSTSTQVDAVAVNNFIYYATAILGLAVLWWVGKKIYQLFKIFF